MIRPLLAIAVLACAYAAWYLDHFSFGSVEPIAQIIRAALFIVGVGCLFILRQIGASA